MYIFRQTEPERWRLDRIKAMARDPFLRRSSVFFESGEEAVIDDVALYGRIGATPEEARRLALDGFDGQERTLASSLAWTKKEIDRVSRLRQAFLEQHSGEDVPE